ncbi:nuclear transport factor 2 family protein [Mucilaginibacter agri]|uniref:DUF4440 domain-containing protein n=1 Tax=Mucilaginibacter agri TaxID=2695265 RepID=A0A966DSS9_9SPHI|nr:nuclear transport factor 2 family protein [Mucilaginibacter agri]NCD68557.1 DUF4440 domain-containing protein [Mucilaginibacter agri]
MKAIFLIAFIIPTLNGLGQTPAEAGVLELSKKVFNWEVDNRIDSLANLLDVKFTAFTSSGDKQTKEQYLAVLRSGNVVHNSIEVEESTATVVSNTATVAGKGRFRITVNGNKRNIHLSYLEVFIRLNEHTPWKMLALHAGLLSN